MKQLISLALCLTLIFSCAYAAEIPDSTPVPGRERVQGKMYSYQKSSDLAALYGVSLTNDLPIYTPASPQPMNAYMATHKDCEVGINNDGMYKVEVKGLVNSITKYLNEWQEEIVAQSAGAIQFVDDPDDADILIVVCQSYEYYGKYSGGGITSTGYSSHITFEARQLTATGNKASLSQIRKPGSTESIGGGAKFWKYPPDLEDTKALENFVSDILEWYGFGAKTGSRGEGVKALQQELVNRGFMKGKVDGAFGAMTQAALKSFQQEKGLEETGAADEATLIALYYD